MSFGEKIAIVGAGIIGTTTAVAIKESLPGCEVVIYSETFSPDTTGDGSAGLWGPYLCGTTPEIDIVYDLSAVILFISRWSGETHRWLEGLWKSGLTPETGVSLLPITRVSGTPGFYQSTPWIHLVYGCRRLSDEQIDRLNKEHRADYRDGLEFLSYTSEPTRLIPWLMKKFRSLNGITRARRINKLNELAEEGYGIVINCSGLGAGELVGDSLVKPIRGQVTRVDAPWSFRVILCDDDDGNYIVPNIDSVVLGGTHQENDYDRTVRPEDSKFIHQGCARMIPAYERSRVISEWVGLRPGRCHIRLESEICRKSSGEEFAVIHNYGHGGSGVTLAWGCALDVVRILKGLIKMGPRSPSHL